MCLYPLCSTSGLNAGVSDQCSVYTHVCLSSCSNWYWTLVQCVQSLPNMFVLFKYNKKQRKNITHKDWCFCISDIFFSELCLLLLALPTLVSAAVSRYLWDATTETCPCSGNAVWFCCCCWWFSGFMINTQTSSGSRKWFCTFVHKYTVYLQVWP